MSTTTGGSTTVRWHGQGLYRIDPNAVDPNLQPIPIPGFFPVGHLAITPAGVAVATALSADNPVTAYDRLVQVPLPPSGRELPPIALPESGRDDLAIAVTERDVAVAYVVVDRGRNKAVLGREVGSGVQIGNDDALIETSGAVRLVGMGDAVGVTLADSYGMQLIDAQTAKLVDRYFLPLQVGPISAAFTPAQRRLLPAGLRPELRVEHDLGDRRPVARPVGPRSTSPRSRPTGRT